MNVSRVRLQHDENHIVCALSDPRGRSAKCLALPSRRPGQLEFRTYELIDRCA
jgi:hypothetical protein